MKIDPGKRDTALQEIFATDVLDNPTKIPRCICRASEEGEVGECSTENATLAAIGKLPKGGKALTSTRLSPVLKPILKSRSLTLVATRRCYHVAALLKLGS